MTPRWLTRDAQRASAPASGTDYYSVLAANGVRASFLEPGRWVPPPLDRIGPDVMLAVAPVRGPEPWQWREAAPGAWMAWPHATGAGLTEEMTAGQLRDLLAARDAR